MDNRNKNNPLVSIIVPIYNVEPYLIKCLESIEAQTYSNIECIMVVDGATDHSYEIAKEFCRTHHRFKVFYQENAGSGPARNKGITFSSGEFICFIDPDDWVEINYVESLVHEQRLRDYDLVISQSVDRKINLQDEIIASSRKTKPKLSYVTQYDCRENFPLIMFKHHYLDGPICKLFKSSIIKNNNIEFPSYRRSQDMVFNFRYFNNITSICTISVYSYNIRSEIPSRGGRGRIFTNYHEIVAKIYLELANLLSDWKIKNDYSTLFHTWSFWYLYAYIIRCVDAHISYEFVKNEPYLSIIEKACPNLLTQKIVRFFLVKKMYSTVNLIGNLISKLKKYTRWLN